MATTLLSFLDLPPGTLEYAVDLNPHKHGSWTPGHRLLIRPVETLEDRPDVALLLAWNFADAILEAQGAVESRWRAILDPHSRASTRLTPFPVADVAWRVDP